MVFLTPTNELPEYPTIHSYDRFSGVGSDDVSCGNVCDSDDDVSCGGGDIYGGSRTHRNDSGGDNLSAYMLVPNGFQQVVQMHKALQLQLLQQY